MDNFENNLIDAFIKKGHTFIMTDPEEEIDGIPKPDMFAFSIGFHNGPVCSKCGWQCCEHCVDIEKIPQCEG
jgi:hypothetical protein